MLVAMPLAMGVPVEATLAMAVAAAADAALAAVVGILLGAPVEVAAGELVDAGIGGGLVGVGAGRAGAPGYARVRGMRGGRADVGVGITVFVESGGASALAGGG